MTARGERSGGTVRERGTKDGKRVDVYRAACEGCTELGPPSPNSQRGARRLATEAGWLCDQVRRRTTFMESWCWVVRCPTCRTGTLPAPS